MDNLKTFYKEQAEAQPEPSLTVTPTHTVKRRPTYMTALISAACACVLVAGAIWTGAAQAAFDYLRDVFFTKEVIASEDVKGIIFTSQEEYEAELAERIERGELTFTETGTSVQEDISLNEAVSRFEPFKLPRFMPRGVSIDRILYDTVVLYDGYDKEDYDYPDSLQVIYSDGGDNWFNFLIFPTIKPYGEAIRFTDDKFINKYTTANGTELIYYEQSGNHAGIYSLLFTLDNIDYSISIGLEEPLTDEEIVAMVDSMVAAAELEQYALTEDVVDVSISDEFVTDEEPVIDDTPAEDETQPEPSEDIVDDGEETIEDAINDDEETADEGIDDEEETEQ